jgi:hypothetical protein
MKNKKRIATFFMFIFILFSFIQFAQQSYPVNKQRVPTRAGIDLYVKYEQENIIKELEEFLNDTIFIFFEITTDNIEEYYRNQPLDMAYHITYNDGSAEIVIDNRERYIAYDINQISNLKKFNLSTSNQFVKTVLIHELVHTYFLQKVVITKYNGAYVHKEYDFRNMMAIKIYPMYEKTFGAEFIEEGVCQYVVNEMRLEIPKVPPVPKTIDDIINNSNDIKYYYSIKFLKPFLDSLGVGEGINILIRNDPPSYNEILKPNIYFKRLL